MDRTVHCPARDPRDGRISGDGYWAAPQRGRNGWREIHARKSFKSCRVLASVACLCGQTSLGGRGQRCRQPPARLTLIAGAAFLQVMRECIRRPEGRWVMSLAYKIIESPVGKLKLVASDNALVAILWERDSPRRVRLSDMIAKDRHPVLVETERQLSEYFSGKRKEFSIPLDMRGTSFQKDVWEALLAIPFGETRSYGQLAKQLGNPRATRAVGAANGR